jgi:hypothetical protein
MTTQLNLPTVLAFLFSLNLAMGNIRQGIGVLRSHEYTYKRFSILYFRNVIVYRQGECVIPEATAKIASGVIWTLILIALVVNGFNDPLNDVIRVIFIPAICAALIELPGHMLSERRFSERAKRKDRKCSSRVTW